MNPHFNILLGFFRYIIHLNYVFLWHCYFLTCVLQYYSAMNTTNTFTYYFQLIFQLISRLDNMDIIVWHTFLLLFNHCVLPKNMLVLQFSIHMFHISYFTCTDPALHCTCCSTNLRCKVQPSSAAWFCIGQTCLSDNKELWRMRPW